MQSQCCMVVVVVVVKTCKFCQKLYTKKKQCLLLPSASRSDRKYFYGEKKTVKQTGTRAFFLSSLKRFIQNTAQRSLSIC